MRNILQYRNILCLLVALIGFTNFAYAQASGVTKGVVRDAMGKPIIGATVVVVKSTILNQ